MLGAGGEHDQPIEAERDPGGLARAGGERREKIVIDRIGLTIECLLFLLVGEKADTLLGGVGQLAKALASSRPQT